MHKTLKILIPALLLIFSILGLTRLKFQTDILEVLPSEIDSVKSLKNFRQHFAEDRQVVVLLSSEDEALPEEDTEALVQFLRKQWPKTEITFKSRLEENPELFAQSVARLWTYAPPEAINELSNRLNNPQALNTHLEQVKADLRNSFDQEKSLIASYDPLGFLNHPALTSLMQEQASFESEDGKHRIILINKNNETDTGYEADARWLDTIRTDIKRWSIEDDTPLNINLTGGPVFNAEIGSSMQQDMSGTITFTSILIGILFIFIQRNIRQLLLINALLALTFLITLGTAGWIFGSLNLVSVGFAAILLGLVIDYAIVIIRESTHAPNNSAKSIRTLVTPSITWAAISTALVFGILIFSTFTGVRQLGALIAIGLIAGAIVMLTLAPIFLAKFPSKPASRLKSPIFPTSKFAILIPTIAILASLTLFIIKGPPSLSLNLSIVEPTKSEASSTFATIQENFPTWSEQNTILITSSTDLETLQTNATKTTPTLNNFQSQNLIENFQWHTAFIPNKKQIQSNLPTLKSIAKNHDQLIASLDQAGFTEKGIGLDSTILTAISKLPNDPEQIITASSNDSLTKLFYHRDEQGLNHFAGRMLMTNPLDSKTLEKLTPLKNSDTHITGWPVLQTTLLPHVTRDFYVIFIPSAGILLLALLIVFRSWKETLISITVLLTALTLINAVVVISGQTWNFLSGMAIPLIVGAGIDYSIHLIFALRRQNGNFAPVWNSVGKAILFCGLSTSIGFASLLFASSELLRSMGLICSIGILITTTLSVLVIPSLWKWCHRARL